jgi:hypothetical protein
MADISISGEYRLQFLEAVRSFQRMQPKEDFLAVHGIPTEGTSESGKLSYYSVPDGVLEILKKAGVPFSRSSN